MYRPYCQAVFGIKRVSFSSAVLAASLALLISALPTAVLFMSTMLLRKVERAVVALVFHLRFVEEEHPC